MTEREMRQVNDDRGGPMNNKDRWPGIVHAYDFVEPSYKWMLSRLRAANGRIQNIMNFSATVMFAAPVLGRSIDSSLQYTAGWFYLALAMFGVIAVLWAYSIASGTVKLPSPGEMLEKKGYYGANEWQFKKNMLYNAKWAYTHNSKLVRCRGNIAIAQTVAFVLQLGGFGVWILG